MLDRAIRLCFRLLEEHPDTIGESQVQSRNLASLIHTISRDWLWDAGSRDSVTAAQFELLVDYHLHICEGTDYHLIKATFWMLEFGSSNNPERMRRYIDTIICFMGEETTCVSALCAASAIRVQIASMTQHNESLRQDFSKTLASAILLDPTRTTLNPFKEISFFIRSQDIPYLQLLCTLAQDPTWHPQLYQHGHFDNCLAIAKTLSSQNHAVFHDYNVPVAHVFAIIDALGDETHPLFNTVQVYPMWPLVL